MFFLGVPYRPTSLLIVYKALLASLFIGVYICIGVTMGVIGGTRLIRVLLVVAVVCKVGICFGLRVLWVYNKGLSVI
jgi:hypothetical protein